MHIKPTTLAATITLACLATTTTNAHAQASVDPAHKYSWGENLGYMNWYDAGGGTQGVTFHDTYLTGRIWTENHGWLSVGETPANGTSYTNANGADFGVNRNPDDTLSGFAWGENIGWVNFDGGRSLFPGNFARIDTDFARLRGYAWAESHGWINFDHATAYVALVGLSSGCPCDVDGTPGVDVIDLLAFLNLWFQLDPGADFNGMAGVDVIDLLAFLECWFPASSGTPCP